MGHTITAFICKDDGTFQEHPHLTLPQGFVLFIEKPEGFRQNRVVAKIETDYFGGCGDQTAKVWENGVKIYEERDSFGPINDALEYLGVKRENGNDEFDTLGLGAYRDYQDLSNAIYNNIQ